MKYGFFLFFFMPMFACAQYIHIPLHTDIYNYAERLEIKGKSDLHTAIGEFSSRSVFTETIDTFASLSAQDRYLASKLIRDYPEYWSSVPESEGLIRKEYVDSTNTFYTAGEVRDAPLARIITPKKPLLKYFYENRNYFSQISRKGFLLKVNPIFYFGAGRDISQDAITFENRRGIALSGHVNDRVYFYSDIVESQAVFPSYVGNFERKYTTIPGFGFYKFYNSSVIEALQGYDFLNATAYINARISKNIGVEFGNNNQFIGNGSRSLLLSDFTNNYLYLKFNTKIWKLHYQNIFAELTPIAPRQNQSGTILPRKYMTTHYLSFKHKNMELGVFESVIFERDGKFDFQYLNPVILYRLVEYNLASSDNVLIGLNGKWNIAKRFQVYGQLIMDEFKLDEFTTQDTSRQGWWANKYGIQAGLRYIDVLGIDNLDIKLEYNRVRPFTYGHRSRASYSHANQALAHPLGANFEEVHFSASYYITPKLHISSSNYLMRQGLDTDEILYGADVLRPSGERLEQFGHFLLQGVSSQTILSDNKISYELLPNYFLDAKLLYRSQTSDVEELTFSNIVFSGAVRINFWEPRLMF